MSAQPGTKVSGFRPLWPVVAPVLVDLIGVCIGYSARDERVGGDEPGLSELWS